jgi:hypothetical protein
VLVLFIFFLICSSLINPVVTVNVIAQDTVEDPSQEQSPPTSLIGQILYFSGKLLGKVIKPIQTFLAAPKAEPAAINVSYGEKASFELGILNLSSGKFQIWDNIHPLFNKRWLNFEVLEYPGTNSQGVWKVMFDPYTVFVNYGDVVKTNVTINLRSPPTLDNAIQSGVLKLRILDTWANGDLWHPAKGGVMDKPGLRLLWLYSAVTMQFGFYSGTVDIQTFDVDVLVKVKPYHAVKFDTVPYIEFKPDSITSVPITLQNWGNYNDTFSFRIKSNRKEIKISDPISLTLAPGETKDTYLGVSIPPNIFDFGTIYNIKIEAFSIDDPNATIAVNPITFETKGLHITEMGAIGIFFLFFIILLGAGLLIYRQRNIYIQYCAKPDKPWELPEEKKNLDKLKEKDRSKYKETLDMMKYEYDSSLLWHKYYCESLIRTELKKNEKAKSERLKAKKKEIEKLKREKEKEKLKKFKEKEEKEKKRVEEKSAKEEVKPEEKPEEKTEEKLKEKPLKIVTKEIVVDEKAQAEKLEKERALLRVKQDQERQKRKFDGSDLGGSN